MAYPEQSAADVVLSNNSIEPSRRHSDLFVDKGLIRGGISPDWERRDNACWAFDKVAKH